MLNCNQIVWSACENKKNINAQLTTSESLTLWICRDNSTICLDSQSLTKIPPQVSTDFELKHGLYLYISAHHIFTQNRLKRRSRGPQAIMYFKKRGMVSRPGYAPLFFLFFLHQSDVSRRWWDNGGDLSDLSTSIVAGHIINVHLWEKPWPLPRCFCIAQSFSLCWMFSLLSTVLYLLVFSLSDTCTLRKPKI